MTLHLHNPRPRERYPRAIGWGISIVVGTGLTILVIKALLWVHRIVVAP